MRLFFLLPTLLFIAPITSAASATDALAKAEKRLQWISYTINKNRNIGQWIDQARGQQKIFRRTYFGRFMNNSLPPAVAQGTSLIVLPIRISKTAKTPSAILSAKLVGAKVHYYFNGRDITRKKKEPMRAWLRRLYPSVYKNKPRKSAFLPFSWINTAHADQPEYSDPKSFQGNPLLKNWDAGYAPNAGNEDSLRQPIKHIEHISALMASMTAEAWSATTYDGSHPAMASLQEAAGAMRYNNGLRCNSDGGAEFNTDLPYENVLIYTKLDSCPEQPCKNGERLARVDIHRRGLKALKSENSWETAYLGRLAYKFGPKGQLNTTFSDTQTPAVNHNNQSVHNHNAAGSHLQAIFNKNKFRDGHAYWERDTNRNQYSANSEDFKSSSEALYVLSHIARACCGNDQCYESVFPKYKRRDQKTPVKVHK